MTTLGQDDWIGLRVAHRRNELGLTQQQLADRTRGKVSRSYLAMIEAGHRPVDKRTTLIALAEALEVSVAWLTATPETSRSPEESAIHAVLPELRAALDGALEIEPRPSWEQLNDDVLALMRARMDCDYITLANGMAPTVARTLALTEEMDHRGGATYLALTCTALSLALRPLGLLDLGIRLAEHARWAAERSGDQALVAGSIFAVAQCALSGGVKGQRARSRALALQGAEMIQGDRSDAGMTWQAMLLLHAALSSATLERDDEAEQYLDEAEDIARHITTDPMLMDPSVANVGVWRTAVALEGPTPQRAPELARRVDQSKLGLVQRRVHLLMHAGKGHYLQGNTAKATELFLVADDLAPGEVRSRSSVRELVGHMLRDERRKAGSGPLRELAVKVGVDPLAAHGV